MQSPRLPTGDHAASLPEPLSYLPLSLFAGAVPTVLLYSVYDISCDESPRLRRVASLLSNSSI